MIRAPGLALVFAALVAAPGASRARTGASALALPVVNVSRDAVTGPAFVSDRIEIRLSPEAARARAAGVSTRATFREHVSRLGVASVDGAAAALGAWFEPEFIGETSPEPGSRTADFTTFYIAHIPEGVALDQALARFREAPGIESADPIAILPVAAIPNDSLWSVSTWFDQPSGHDIHAPAAWDISTGDTSIVVAVLDTGVLPYHPDLGGSVAGEAGQIWTNWKEVNGTPGVDDDGNGFVDDTWGWDFVAQSSLADVAGGEDGAYEDNDPNDFAGHGTFVAGLIGALSDNGIGVTGTVWHVRIMPIRVAWSAPADPLGHVDMSYVAQGIRYATRMGANVINCSFSTVNQSGLYAAADAAIQSGVTIVAAAGNTTPSPQPHELADRDDVIGVAAVNAADQASILSNLGSFVDVSAPGVGISSTFVTHVTLDSIGARQPSYRAGLSGTSMATPLVSGAAALVQARRKALGEKLLSPMGMVLRLRETADDIGAENPGVTGFGTGRLDLARALADPLGSSAWPAGSLTVGPAVFLPGISGVASFAFVTEDAHFMVVNGASGDTVTLATLPGPPARQLAAADFGMGHGVGLFVGTTNGFMVGLDVHGVPLPGWPQSPAGAGGFTGGPAIGDLNDDGVPEIVCGSSTGYVYAWYVDGTVVPGFPKRLDVNGVNQPVALAPIDGVAGLEIVAATQLGDVHVLRGNGTELTGWPISLVESTQAPVVAAFAPGGPPVIIVAANQDLFAFNADGSEHWYSPLPGPAAAPPALADLDGNGADEVVVATFAPAELAVVDSAGIALTARGFPRALPATPAGSPVVGPLRAGGLPCIALDLAATGLVAVTDSAALLARFPEPGFAGVSPVIASPLGDGHSRIVAGSGSDTSLYVYDAGAASFAPLAAFWPAPRGNDARTGSRLGAPSMSTIDDIPPAAITDLTAGFQAPDSVVLNWNAPGGDGATGRASRYELRVSAVRTDAADFLAGYRTDLPAPDAAGAPQHFAIRVSANGLTLYFAIRARDAAGNAGAASNIAAFVTPLGGPFPVTNLSVAASRDSSVMLRWSAPPFGVSAYEIRAARFPIDQATFGSAPLRFLAAPGALEADSARLGPFEPGSNWWFALRTIDPSGGTGPLSNVAAITLSMGGALGGRAGVALAVRAQPSRAPVRLDWQGARTGENPSLEIYDVTGRRVRSFALPRGRFGATQEWDGRDDEQRFVPAGLYFARLICGSVHAQARIVLLP